MIPSAAASASRRVGGAASSSLLVLSRRCARHRREVPVPVLGPTSTVVASTSTLASASSPSSIESGSRSLFVAASASAAPHPSQSLKSPRSTMSPRCRWTNNEDVASTGTRRTLFIQTESTPNPESIKFIPGRVVLTDEMAGESGNAGFYATRDEKSEIARSPLAKEIFAIDGVKSIYLGSDFVTVTKDATAHWSHIRTLVFSALMDFYASGKPALTEVAEITDTTILDDDDEVVAMIKELLESRIRPAVQEDGGDIRYVGFEPETGLVTVKLAGSCVGCPSSTVTLKNGVENMLMHYVPEVTGVDALEEEAEDGGDGGGGGGGVVVDKTTTGDGEGKKMKSYEERLAAAGIPFSD